MHIFGLFITVLIPGPFTQVLMGFGWDLGMTAFSKHSQNKTGGFVSHYWETLFMACVLLLFKSK